VGNSAQCHNNLSWSTSWRRLLHLGSAVLGTRGIRHIGNMELFSAPQRHVLVSLSIVGVSRTVAGKMDFIITGERANYAFKPIAEQALRSNQSVMPQRLNAALGLRGQLSVRRALFFAGVLK